MKLSYQTQANEAKLGFVDNWSKLGKKLRFDLDKLRLEMLSVRRLSTFTAHPLI